MTLLAIATLIYGISAIGMLIVIIKQGNRINDLIRKNKALKEGLTKIHKYLKSF